MSEYPTPAPITRCAAWAQSEGIDPIGTAGSHAGFCCIEWRRPWPRDIGEVTALRPVAMAAKERRIRLQALLPRNDDTGRVIVYTNQSEFGFTAYRRVEVAKPHHDLPAAALGLLDDALHADSAGKPGVSAGKPGVNDVLVCTHGRRDVCCGSRGTAFLAELADADALGRDVRLWATSHIGGHRFAPTAIILPAGTLWAFLDAERLQQVVARQGPIEDVLPHYRGCAGLSSPAFQALERAILREVGWRLFDCRRTGAILSDGRVRLDVAAPDGWRSSWEAEVTTSRVLPIPQCGRLNSDDLKQEHQPELVVTGLRRERSG